jgi:hypothetical protein
VVATSGSSLTVDTGLIDTFTTTTDLAATSSPLNNKAKYLVVIGGNVIVSNALTSTTTYTFTPGTYDLSLFPIGEDTVSYVQIPAGATAILTEKGPAIEPFPNATAWILLRVD